MPDSVSTCPAGSGLNPGKHLAELVILSNDRDSAAVRLPLELRIA